MGPEKRKPKLQKIQASQDNPVCAEATGHEWLIFLVYHAASQNLALIFSYKVERHVRAERKSYLTSLKISKHWQVLH